MENSKIEWTDHTFNPWWGCMKVSPGCKNCYAEKLDNRYHNADPHWGPNSSRKPMSEAYWKQPAKWNKQAQAEGVRRRVFCASMADVFEGHPATLIHLTRLFQVIEATSWLDWQLLTKRPENIMGLVPHTWKNQFPDNVWIGTSVENAEQGVRILHLIDVPAKVRFLSCEPLLGRVNLWPMLNLTVEERSGKPGSAIDWVIAGGESGPGARPAHPDWIRYLRDQCEENGVPFLFKQWGEWRPIDKPHDVNGSPVPLAKNERWMNAEGGHGFHGDEVWRMRRVGKHDAGNELDGKQYQNFPVYRSSPK